MKPICDLFNPAPKSSPADPGLYCYLGRLNTGKMKIRGVMGQRRHWSRSKGAAENL